MILTCPACAARYEVAAAALPEGGRAVECSACGHGWFWRPAGPAASTPAESPNAPPPDDDSGGEPPDYDSLPPRPPLEERLPAEVLAVLRDEAAREMAARAADGARAAASGAADPRAADVARQGAAPAQAGGGARAGAGPTAAEGDTGDNRASAGIGESPALAARIPQAGHGGLESGPKTDMAEAAGERAATKGAAATGPLEKGPGDGRADTAGAVPDRPSATGEGASDTAGPELPAGLMPARRSGGEAVQHADAVPPPDAGAEKASHAVESAAMAEGRRPRGGALRALAMAILLIPVVLALLHAFAAGLEARFPALAPFLEALQEGVAALRRAIGGEG